MAWQKFWIIAGIGLTTLLPAQHATKTAPHPEATARATGATAVLAGARVVAKALTPITGGVNTNSSTACISTSGTRNIEGK